MSSVSIVVPTLHAPRLIDTLVALSQQTSWTKIGEILVVGQQESGRWQRVSKVHYVPVDDRPTPARNRNRGAAEAAGDWICFTDSDCVPHPCWIEALLSAAEESGAEALCGSVVVPSDVSYWGLADHLLVFQGVTVRSACRPLARMATLNFCIRRSLFQRLGGFDEAFSAAAGEDTDFSERLTASGAQILFVPGATVEHRHQRQHFRDAWQHIFGYGEAVTQRRQLRGMDWRWRVATRLLALPGLLEAMGVGRALARAPGHLWQIGHVAPGSFYAWPGVVVLDFALSCGMIQSLQRSARE